MSRSIRLPLAMVLATLALVFTAVTSTATPVKALCISKLCVKTVDDGYEYSYDAATRAFLGVQHFSVTGDPGVTYETTYVIDCGIVGAPDPGGGPGGLDCARAQCQAGPKIGRWLILFYRQTAPTPQANWTRGDRRCAVARDPIPITAVDAAVTDYVRKHLHPATAIVQPAQVTLVQFPTILSTPDPGQVTFPIDQPLPGTVTVHPTFTWTLTDPDGTATTTTGPGRPYDGTGPTHAPTGYYLTHAFTHRGTAHVQLTATWTGTVTVQTLPAVALDPLLFRDNTDLAVHENIPVLIGTQP